MGRRPKRRHADDQETPEKMLNIANYRETQIETVMRHHLTAVIMAIIKVYK